MRFQPLLNLLNSEAKLKVLQFVFKQSYHSMSERELAKLIGISNESVRRIMQEFHDFDLVYPQRLGTAVTWNRNKTSFAYKELKKVVNPLNSLESPKDHLIKTIKSALSDQPVEKVVLFGSVARGEERPGSDIDLFILTSNESTKLMLQEPLNKLGVECLKLYGNSFQPTVMTESDYAHPTNVYLMKNLKNGITIIS